MGHVEVRHGHLYSFSLASLGAIALGILLLALVIAGLLMWHHHRSHRGDG